MPVNTAGSAGSAGSVTVRFGRRGVARWGRVCLG
uniref:Uncharacterized protein n=1 Tax=Siphoviridae sp. ct2hZ16 TaxID=2826276 RepID=A0A8S5QVR2_9CAUD|nr:MAG TPA: hypothetical protein [Siphoviridae sp. ct2hZ16]